MREFSSGSKHNRMGTSKQDNAGLLLKFSAVC